MLVELTRWISFVVHHGTCRLVCRDSNFAPERFWETLVQINSKWFPKTWGKVLGQNQTILVELTRWVIFVHHGTCRLVCRDSNFGTGGIWRNIDGKQVQMAPYGMEEGLGTKPCHLEIVLNFSSFPSLSISRKIRENSMPCPMTTKFCGHFGYIIMGWTAKNHLKIRPLDTFFHFSRFYDFRVFEKIKKILPLHKKLWNLGNKEISFLWGCLQKISSKFGL